ncbi:MAG TPA: class I SAM-dependent methyltransferase [Acidimicrobiia bacterium]|nr:class I SAM-dependent methyltransferase [Acidimicrobiia bacterium]
MNEEHLAVCASDEWRDALKQWIMPWALTGVELGADVIEIGPGPGLTTDELRQQVARLTAVELDPSLAGALAERLAGTNVEVVNADATAIPLDDDRFTGAVSFTMLHHVPTLELQDRIFGELARVLAPDGALVLSDSVASDDLRAFHDGDTYNPVDPTTVDARLARAGFDAIDVRVNEYGWAAHARKR